MNLIKLRNRIITQESICWIELAPYPTCTARWSQADYDAYDRNRKIQNERMGRLVRLRGRIDKRLGWNR